MVDLTEVTAHEFRPGSDKTAYFYGPPAPGGVQRLVAYFTDVVSVRDIGEKEK